MTNKYLQSYLIAVQHPHVSGFEHLDMLAVRDKLAQQRLTTEEALQLTLADQTLLNRVRDFYNALQSITDLQEERQNRQRTPDQWWWYLDVLAQLPIQATKGQPTSLQPAITG